MSLLIAALSDLERVKYKELAKAREEESRIRAEARSKEEEARAAYVEGAGGNPCEGCPALSGDGGSDWDNLGCGDCPVEIPF